MDIASPKNLEKIAQDSVQPVSYSVDVFVGKRLRELRVLKGISQAQLGKAVGVTFQQIQKYEVGANRISASRLFQVASILSVPVSDFFIGIEEMASLGCAKPSSASGKPSLHSLKASEKTDAHRQRETLDLVSAYYRIQDSSRRRKIYELIKLMAAEDQLSA